MNYLPPITRNAAGNVKPGEFQPRPIPAPPAVAPRRPSSELWSGEPSKFGAVDQAGAVTLNFAGIRAQRLLAHPAGINGASDAAVEAVVSACGSVNELAARVVAAMNDSGLSQQGREAAFAGAARAALVTIAGAATRLKAFEDVTTARDQALIAPPPLPSEPGPIARAAEVRAWVLAMDPPSQMAAFAKALEDPDGQEMAAAMLNSPIRLADPVREHSTTLWRAHRRAANPTEADAIDQARLSADFDAPSLALVAATARQLALTWGGADVLDRLLIAMPSASKEAAHAFGYSVADLALAKTRVEVAAAGATVH